MQSGRPDHLDVVVPLAEHALGRFPDQGKGFHLQIVEGFPRTEPLPKLDRFGRERRV